MPLYHGVCCCGEIAFNCEGDPFFTQYCHCNKCREVASLSKCKNDKAGYSCTAAYLSENFHITTGKDNLIEIIRNNATLFLCPSCKSLIYGISRDPNQQTVIGVNTCNFIFTSELPLSFKPVRHTWYVSRIIDFHDNLPKYKDTPKEQFGSGEVIDEKS